MGASRACVFSWMQRRKGSKSIFSWVEVLSVRKSPEKFGYLEVKTASFLFSVSFDFCNTTKDLFNMCKLTKRGHFCN
jgi:hypothetical protein